ncbi:MAG: hypothetical protein A3I61_19915 [Acidobacteria bacterium RIFCSPLOWO2_02_FULL_68_18]|nr:MAG: hypothetical protein A3I61_19915 [Acidobacteria bacterium RIFCSPLOWO2_02_FULL_68_18]OFW48270.1 MAG: hypothetical protein A3G77_03225 [Acidobacteria bacterium RIFCSPLOWO2_12_FULL_68_19]
MFGAHRYEVIYVGGEAIYVHPRVLLRALWHVIATRHLTLGYVLAVLEWMKPSIVVTFVDNTLLFYMAARQYRAARFLAIQNGNRLPARDNPPGTPEIYFREFACLGRFEIDQFTRHGARVERYYPIGSLKDSYYRAYRAGAAPAIKEFDLCLPSQFKPNVRLIHSERFDSFEVLTQHVRRFCETHGVSLCVPLRYHPDHPNRAGYEWEHQFFEMRLGRYARLFPNMPGEFTTYGLVDRSRVSLGMHTTVLREGFGRGNRVLSCNYSGNSVYTFPVPGPWALTDPAYEAFEERLLWLLNASEEEYARACGDLPSYLIGYDDNQPTHVFLQRVIADAVRGAAEPSADGQSHEGWQSQRQACG